jgi:hypothetical protein
MFSACPARWANLFDQSVRLVVNFTKHVLESVHSDRSHRGPHNSEIVHGNRARDSYRSCLPKRSYM